MNRLVVFVLAMVSTIAISTAFAQVKIGFTAGANFNKPSYSMSGDSLYKANEISSFGGHGGLYSYVNLAGKKLTFGLQSELLVSFRSHATQSKDSLSVHPDIKYYRESFAQQQMIYLDLPIHFRYNLIMQKGRFGDANMLSFLVGPQTSFALGRNYSVEHTYVTYLHDQPTILRENSNRATFKYKPLEIGISAGVQLELQAGFRAGFRYYRSFMSAAEHDSLKIVNQMMMLYVGYNFATINKKRR